MLRFHTLPLLLVLLCLSLSIQFDAAQTATLTVHADTQGKPINADLFGIFFEDLNYAADGGLYAELVQNRSFKYSPADNKKLRAAYRAGTCPARRQPRIDHRRAGVSVERNNPHCAVLGHVGRTRPCGSTPPYCVDIVERNTREQPPRPIAKPPRTVMILGGG